MQRSSPRASAGLSMLPASMAPSAAPAPTTVCSSSMKRTTRPSEARDLLEHGLEPLLELAAVLGPGDHRAQVEGHQAAVARASRARRRSPIRWASPSAIAVLPTPGSPIRTGLFLVRRESTWMTRRISSSRPITGSSLPRRAASVRSRPYFSRAWYFASGLASVTRWEPRTASRRRVDLLRGDPRLLEHPGRFALGLADDGEQQVLGGDVLVLEPGHLVEGGHQHGAERGAHGGLGGADLLGSRLQRRLQARGQRLGLHLEAPQQGGDQAVVLVEQGEQQVLGLDGGVLEAGGGRLGGLQCLLGAFGESIKTHVLCIPRDGAPEPRAGGGRPCVGSGGRRRHRAGGHAWPPVASNGNRRSDTRSGRDYDAGRSHRWPLTPSAPPSS